MSKARTSQSLSHVASVKGSLTFRKITDVKSEISLYMESSSGGKGCTKLLAVFTGVKRLLYRLMLDMLSNLKKVNIPQVESTQSSKKETYLKSKF